MEIPILKWLHVCSSMLLFGTGLGTAFFKFTADLGRDVHVMADTNRRVVLADWLFTTPTVVIQPLSGFALMHLYGYPWSSPWLVASFALYLLAGLCWLPVVYLQIRMRDDCAAALNSGQPLDPRYWRDARAWFWLGVPAFLAMVAVLFLMVAKPALDF
ncbi:DUF2269 family protein [Methylogaea oryzae]|uniref:Membrane protein n=1 Tax=Methylogaea oryzae TaxID=1295382 RepID=A0A8D4VMG4_9GAMM|nr:DUF2269 domain-containing protein [Methylogaea oryzae]BBL70207.1 membrane protein [Methylogaea oryzae]